MPEKPNHGKCVFVKKLVQKSGKKFSEKDNESQYTNRNLLNNQSKSTEFKIDDESQANQGLEKAQELNEESSREI